MNTQQRVEWVDVAKGIGIVLVVFGHVWRGLNEAGLITDQPMFDAVDAAIYLFHMPLFFFVSGLFFEGAIAKRGVVGSLPRRAEALLYPLILWSYVTAAFLIVASQLTNRPPISFIDAALYPFPPKDIYWFLWALFVIQTISSLVANRPIAIVLALFTAATSILLIFGVTPFPGLLQRTVENLPFLLAGVLATRMRFRWASRPLALAGLAAFVLAEFWAITHSSELDTSLGYILGGVAVLGFCLIIWQLTNGLPATASNALASLGKASIAVYVTHVIVLAAVRIVLMKLNIQSLPIHLVVGTTVATIAPLTFYYVVQRLGLLRIFGLGFDKKRQLVARTSPATVN